MMCVMNRCWKTCWTYSSCPNLVGQILKMGC